MSELYEPLRVEPVEYNAKVLQLIKDLHGCDLKGGCHFSMHYQFLPKVLDLIEKNRDLMQLGQPARVIEQRIKDLIKRLGTNCITIYVFCILKEIYVYVDPEVLEKLHADWIKN